MAKEKIKPIELEMEDGKKYTLEFARADVKYAESFGFRIEEITAKPVTGTERIFYFAFHKNHPDLTIDDTNKILYEDLGGIDDKFMFRLGELYAQGMESLVNEKGVGKNSKVKVRM